MVGNIDAFTNTVSSLQNGEEAKDVDPFDEKIPLSTIILVITVNRANLLEASIRAQANEIQKRNDTIRQSQTLDADVNGLLPDAAASDTALTPQAIDEFERVLRPKLEALGIRIDGDVKTRGDLEKIRTRLKSEIDANSSTQQLATLRLQNNSNNYQQAFELASNFIAKYFGTQGTLTSNLARG